MSPAERFEFNALIDAAEREAARQERAFRTKLPAIRALLAQVSRRDAAWPRAGFRPDGPLAPRRDDGMIPEMDRQ